MDWYIYLIIAICLALAAFIAIILIRTIKFKPLPAEKHSCTPIAVDKNELGERLAEIIRCKTVSYKDASKEDDNEFAKLECVVKKNYPKVFSACEYCAPSSRSMLFRWKGKSSESCSVLMAHYDVVPVEEEHWEKPPFAGIVENGTLWGRGTLDTKSTYFSILEAAERLITKGYVPEKDIYFAFAGNEEISGFGAPANVKYFVDNNIKIDMVLDEGGAVVNNVFPGVKAPCALVGIAEKGKAEIHFALDSKGGHASTPPKHTPVGVLASAVTKMEKHTFPANFGGAAGAMFDTLARHSSFPMRLLFANLWCFKPLLSVYTAIAGGEMNALVRTTAAFTMMKGGAVVNVIPPTADVGADYRISTGSTVASTIKALKKVIKNNDIKIYTLEEMDPSPVSTLNSAGFARLQTTINEYWPDAIVSPYLMIACSDSKYFSRISDKVYRFSAMALTKEERGMIHGHNERITLENLAKTVQFYVSLMEKC